MKNPEPSNQKPANLFSPQRRNRHFHKKVGALVFARFEADRAVVGFDDFFAYSEAEAAARGLGGEVRLEHAVANFLRDAAAVVADLHRRVAVLVAGQRHVNLTFPV